MKTKFETVIGLYKGIIEDKATTDDDHVRQHDYVKSAVDNKMSSNSSGNSFPCHHVLYCIGRIYVFKNFRNKSIYKKRDRQSVQIPHCQIVDSVYGHD
jgi:hypothetical protein